MPRIGETYPDKFMKAAHLEEMDPDAEHYTFTIRGSEIAEYNDGKQQICLTFRETRLMLGLNKGNATILADLYDSDDTDDWVGKKVVLHIEIVKNSFAPGGKGPAIRISSKQTVNANKAAKPAPAGRKVEPVTQADVDAMEDEDDTDDGTPF